MPLGLCRPSGRPGGPARRPRRSSGRFGQGEAGPSSRLHRGDVQAGSGRTGVCVSDQARRNADRPRRFGQATSRASRGESPPGRLTSEHSRPGLAKGGPEMKQDHTISRFAQLGARSHLPYEVRLERFNLLHAMRNGMRPYDRTFSLRQAADEMVRLGYERMSRERVRQLVKQGAPRERGTTEPSLPAIGRNSSVASSFGNRTEQRGATPAQPRTARSSTSSTERLADARQRWSRISAPERPGSW